MHLSEANLSFLHEVPFQMSECIVGFKGSATFRIEGKGLFSFPGTNGLFSPITVQREYGFR